MVGIHKVITRKLNVASPLFKLPGLNFREVSLKIPTVVRYHDCVPSTLIPSLSVPDGISSPPRHSLNPGSQEIGPDVKIGSASWRSCCIPGFWKQSACFWQVLCSFWPYCCQESSSLPEEMHSTIPVPLRSLSFWTLDLWWTARFEDCQRCQLSTSPRSILEKPGTSKWSSHHLVQGLGELLD